MDCAGLNWADPTFCWASTDMLRLEIHLKLCFMLTFFCLQQIVLIHFLLKICKNTQILVNNSKWLKK